MPDEVVKYRMDNAIATITLNRPEKANTLRLEVIEALDRYLDSGLTVGTDFDPEGHDVYRRGERVTRRRDHVLRRMLAEDLIDEAAWPCRAARPDNRRIVIGRHSRPQAAKFPASLETALQWPVVLVFWFLRLGYFGDMPFPGNVAAVARGLERLGDGDGAGFAGLGDDLGFRLAPEHGQE